MIDFDAIEHKHFDNWGYLECQIFTHSQDASGGEGISQQLQTAATYNRPSDPSEYLIG